MPFLPMMMHYQIVLRRDAPSPFQPAFDTFPGRGGSNEWRIRSVQWRFRARRAIPHPRRQPAHRLGPFRRLAQQVHAYLDESVNFGARVSSANGISAGSFDRDNSEIQFDGDDAIPQFR